MGRVAVIGGGVAGLTAAYRLLQLGHQVDVLEASPYLGGLVRTFEIGGERIECFYHHIFTTDAEVVRLVDEVGLGDRLSWRPSSVAIYYGGRMFPFMTPIDLVRFSPLPLWERLRLGIMGLYLRRQEEMGPFLSVTAREWVSRFAGCRSWEVVWGPLFRGKFGEMGDEVVMAWLWNKIKLRFSSRKGTPWREVLGYLRGSFGLLIDALVARIEALGGHLYVGVPVEQVVIEEGRAKALLAGQKLWGPYDAIVATVANEIFLRLVSCLPEDFKRLCLGVPYQDALCMVLALRHSLVPYYWLTINDRSFPFLAVIEHTRLVPPSFYGGVHIVYISNYLDPSSPLLSMDEEELWGLYLPFVRRLNPWWDDGWVVGRWVFKGKNAQPVFTVANAGRIPPHRTPIPGLYLANMSQIFPQDRGQNYSIMMGERVASLVDQDLGRCRLASKA